MLESTDRHCSRVSTPVVARRYGGRHDFPLSCALSLRISGSSPVTEMPAVGTVMLPALINQGYDRKFALGAITLSGNAQESSSRRQSHFHPFTASSTREKPIVDCRSSSPAGFIPGVLFCTASRVRLRFLENRHNAALTLFDLLRCSSMLSVACSWSLHAAPCCFLGASTAGISPEPRRPQRVQSCMPC